MENPLDQKLDLSALHLGNISLGTLLGALLTLVICLVAVRLLTALLRWVLAQTHMDARVQKYLVRTVQLVLWVVTVLIPPTSWVFPSRPWWRYCRCCPWRYPWRCRTSWPMWQGAWCCW